jgi:hypothetical protein
MQVWKTLPCRVKSVVVHMPSSFPPALAWLAKQTATSLLSAKMRSRCHYVQGDDPLAEEG